MSIARIALRARRCDRPNANMGVFLFPVGIAGKPRRCGFCTEDRVMTRFPTSQAVPTGHRPILRQTLRRRGQIQCP